MRISRALAAVLLASIAAACGSDPVTAARPSAARGDLVLPPESEVVPGRVPPNTTLDRLLREAGVRGDEVAALVAAGARVFDPRRLRAGQPWKLERTMAGDVRRFEYEVDPERYLQIVPDPAVPDGFTADLESYDTRTERATVAGGIDEDTSSLFAAMSAAGETPELPIALADIFSGDVDFNNDLQPGDRFELVVEKIYRDHRLVKYGPILAAVLQNNGRSLAGIRYTPDGGPASYYDLDGRSLKRFFLRSPLKFDPQITSGFSRARVHPVLHTVRAHLGVDYRAPVGAPVVAVASGVVKRAGWSGGSGRLVAIRHSGGYESFYLHLSSVAVHPGAHVSQGTFIGRVGQSGLATGPHLDYRLRRNGVWVNPVLEHRRMPPGKPIPVEQLDAFRSARDEVLRGLDLAPPPAVADASRSAPDSQP